MILLALALAYTTHGVPNSYWSDVCLERDDPQQCARQYRRDERRAFRVCGPDGTVDWDNYPKDPDCNRSGWDGHRYRERRSR
jgi:hypothetical protein